MALIDKASLLMVPSTYEAGTLYNVLPSGNRAPDSTNQNSGYDQTRADFDFDRGSNAAATRVNASGLIEKYRENLLLQSETFDNASWTKSNASITANSTIAPDGTTTADTFAITANFGTILQTPTISSGVVSTYSVYVKNIDAAVFNLQVRTASTAGLASFNFSGATLTSSTLTSGITQGFSDAGNGWYRCYVTFVTNETNQLCRLQIQDSGDSVYIWGVQLEKGLVASSYLESTSVTGKAGVLVDLPRINYDANGENGALLLEPSRANLITQSEYFGGFTTTEANVTTNSGTSPEGVQNASSVIETTALNNRRILPNNPFTGTGGANYTLSVYVKKIAGQPTRHIYWMCQLGADAIYAHFDMDDFSVHEQNDNGTGSVTNADIIPVGNDWYRLILSGSISTTGGDYYNQLYFEDTQRTGFNAQSYTGNGSSGFEIYGWQIELGSYVSSYIPTMGTSETRAADECSVTGVSDVIGQTEGTMFLEFNSGALDGEIQGFSVNDGSSQNRIVIFKNQNDRVQLQVRLGGVVQASIESSDLTANTNYKAALAYANNDVVLYLNGTQVGTDTSATIPTCSDVCFDSDSNGGSPLFKETKQALLFKTRLTNAELAALTL